MRQTIGARALATLLALAACAMGCERAQPDAPRASSETKGVVAAASPVVASTPTLSAAVTATAAPESQAAAPPKIVFILDASGSMAGKAGETIERTADFSK